MRPFEGLVKVYSVSFLVPLRLNAGGLVLVDGPAEDLALLGVEGGPTGPLAA